MECAHLYLVRHEHFSFQKPPFIFRWLSYCCSVRSPYLSTLSLFFLPLWSRRSVYGSYLVFQLFSHKNLYEDDHPNVQKSVAYNRHPERKESVADVEARAQEKEQEEEKPQMSVTVTVALLVIVTVVC